MTQREFVDTLRRILAAQKIDDIEDIIGEYEQHFRCKLADGYDEKEIISKLGSPAEVAKQFLPEKSAKPAGSGRLFTAFGLGFTDLMTYAMAFPLFGGGIAAIGGSALACLAGGLVLLFKQNATFSIPYIPYGCALLFGASLLALGVLAALGTWYCVLYFVQFLRAYGRWHKNMWAAANGNPVFPSLAVYPQLSGKFRRRVRFTTLTALALALTTMILGYIVTALSAGSLEFWHVWNWFV